jgi:hypothetical protein
VSSAAGRDEGRRRGTHKELRSQKPNHTSTTKRATRSAGGVFEIIPDTVLTACALAAPRRAHASSAAFRERSVCRHSTRGHNSPPRPHR